MPLILFGGAGGGAIATAAPYDAPTYFPPAYFYGAVGGDSSAPSDPASGFTPYNAPTYFAPAYFFGGAGVLSAPVSGLTPYDAPTYFAPAYFYGGATAPVPPSAVASGIPLGRDGACYAALVAALGAAGVFDAVSFGDPSRRNGLGADAYPLAIVTPRGWEELDDTDPPLDVRKVTFTVRVVIRVEDDPTPFDQLDRLAAAVQAQVDRSDLGGQALPALTKIRAGRYQSSSQYPEWSVDLDGEFSLLIDPSADPVVL